MNIKEFFEGKNEQEKLEKFSYLVIIVSAILIGFGLLLGSFIRYIVYIGTFGSFLTLIGILLYIVSQFMHKGE